MTHFCRGSRDLLKKYHLLTIFVSGRQCNATDIYHLHHFVAPKPCPHWPHWPMLLSRQDKPLGLVGGHRTVHIGYILDQTQDWSEDDGSQCEQRHCSKNQVNHNDQDKEN